MSGDNRYSAFFDTLGHVVQESVGCNDYPLLAFSKFMMTAKMTTQITVLNITIELHHIESLFRCLIRQMKDDQTEFYLNYIFTEKTQ